MTEVFISASLQHASDGSFMHVEMNSNIFRLLAVQFKTGGEAWIYGFSVKGSTHTDKYVQCFSQNIADHVLHRVFSSARSLVGFYQVSVPEVRSHSFSRQGLQFI